MLACFKNLSHVVVQGSFGHAGRMCAKHCESLSLARSHASLLREVQEPYRRPVLVNVFGCLVIVTVHARTLFAGAWEVARSLVVAEEQPKTCLRRL